MNTNSFLDPVNPFAFRPLAAIREYLCSFAAEIPFSLNLQFDPFGLRDLIFAGQVEILGDTRLEINYKTAGIVFTEERTGVD